MSDPMNPAVPGRTRPGSVAASSWLLFLVVALQLAGVVVGLSVLGELADVYDEAYEGTDLEGSGAALAAFGVIVGPGLGLAMAIVLAILAIFNNRGKNGTRITTWVIGGLLLCCSGFGLIGQLAGGFNVGGGGNNMPDAKEVQEKVNDAVPWLTPTASVLGLASLLAVGLALVLLALPPSNEFFRKRQAAWEPPVPGYPAAPGYPPAGQPGYPPAGQPGYPPSDQPPPSQPPGP